jgi:short-subunit dehydrogenase
MRAQGGGRIVNISSIGGKVAVPHLTPYCASKFALSGLSSAMGAELKRDRITVTTVCPGLMRTGSFFNAWFKGRHRREFAWFAIADSTPVLSVGAERAAAEVVDAALCGDAHLVIGWPAKLAVLASATVPNTLAALMALSNRLLPSPAEPAGHESWTGWQSTSRWAPSALTALSSRPVIEHNQLPAS